MHSEESAFIASIKAEPDDDAPRLIFADWLDEHGEAERAEFIRVQCELARYPIHFSAANDDLPCPTCGPKKVCRRECELLTTLGNWRKLAGEFPLLMTHTVPSNPLLMTRTVPSRFDGHAHVSFVRGFICSLSCTAADWLAHGDSIYERNPVREVRLSTWPRIVESSIDASYYLAPGEMFGSGGPTNPNAQAEFSRELLEARWPGVTFHLPEQRTIQFNTNGFRYVRESLQNGVFTVQGSNDQIS